MWYPVRIGKPEDFAMDDEVEATLGRIRIIVEMDFFDRDLLTYAVDRMAEVTAQLGSAVQVYAGDGASQLPPVTSSVDQQILEWVTEDPDLTDAQIGRNLGMSRQAVSERRRKLQAMGYRVR